MKCQMCAAEARRKAKTCSDECFKAFISQIRLAKPYSNKKILKPIILSPIDIFLRMKLLG